MERRIHWISILRGATIALVVMNHVRLLNAETGTSFAFIDDVRSLFMPLRIPTFVFVSGALLYLTRISKEWKVVALYMDKAKRILLPLLFCTLLGCLSQALFNGIVKNPKPVDLNVFLLSFVDYDNTPWPHRWYLITLLWMMLLYPLYRAVLKARPTIVTGVMLLLAVLYMADFPYHTDINYFYLLTLNKYLPYFFLGIVTLRYEWWRYADNYLSLFINWAAYWALYCLSSHDTFSMLLMGVTGIGAMVSTCLLVSHHFPNLFSSFRNYIFQIYLFGIAFQAFVELVIWRAVGCPSQFVILFYALNVLAGIYLPVLMSRVIERVPSKLVRLCFGLK